MPLPSGSVRPAVKDTTQHVAHLYPEFLAVIGGDLITLIIFWEMTAITRCSSASPAEPTFSHRMRY